MRRTGLWWWIDRWRKSSAFMDMTLEEQGAYRNLLDEAALRGGTLPNDERMLAKACGDATRWKALREVLMKRFVLSDDRTMLQNETLNEVLAESRLRSEKQRSYRERVGNAAPNGEGNAARNSEGNAAPTRGVTRASFSR